MNYPKKKFPDQVVNTQNLTEPIDKQLHELLHETTSSGTNKYVDPVSPEYEIPINNTKIGD